MSTNEHANLLDSVSVDLLNSRCRFEAEISDVLILKDAFNTKITRFQDEAQRLNIAVMGQVKAGKSSFLNALLFNGLPVLPEAATPKTANLTRISWGENYRLDIEYYTKDDWKMIEAAALEKGSHAEAQVARELVAMGVQAKSKGINVHDLLGTKEEVCRDSLDALMGELNKYVGNDGERVAFVKMTRLFLPIPELQGFDVVDTPGMNDPVISRVEKTKQEMARSDVVFFLSRCSRFLDSVDTDLLARQLPGNGVKRICLVGAQFDSTIQDDGVDRQSLVETESNIKRRLIDGARKVLNTLAEQREQKYPEHAKLLRTMTKPILSSTFAYGFANWPEDRWNNAMQHSFIQIKELAEESWDGYTLTKDDWNRLANFELLKQAYQEARADKEAILREQKDGLLPEARQQLHEALRRLRESVDNRIIALQKGDLAELNQKSTQCEQRIQVVSLRLSDVINESLDKVTTTSKDILQSLEEDRSEHGQLRERTGTKTESRDYTVSASTWYKPWTWGDTETRSRTSSVSYTYLAASDAIESLCEYADSCASKIKSDFNRIVNRDALRSALRSRLLAELDTASNDFDPGAFRHTLEQVINRLEIPQLELDTANVANMIGAEFSGQVTSDDKMEALRETLKRSLQRVYSDLQKRLKIESKKLEMGLIDLRDNLESALTQEIRNEWAAIKADFEDKDRALKENQRLLALVDKWLKRSIL